MNRTLKKNASEAATICPMTVAIAAPLVPIAGTPNQPKNEDRIEDDVQDCACRLGRHREQGSAGGLQQAFHADLHKYSDRKDTDDLQVIDPVGDDFCILRLKGEIKRDEEQA